MPVPTAPKWRMVVPIGSRRPRASEIGRIGASQERQLPGCGRIGQSGHGAVDVDETARIQLAAHLAGMVIGDGRAFDRDGACLRGLGSALGPKPDRTRGLVIGNHGHDGVGIDRGVLRGRRPMRATRDQVFGLGLATIPQRHCEAGIEIAPGHAMAHPSKPDEGDAGHDQSTSSISPVVVPKARCARVAAMNSSSSPFSTPEVSEVCTPVRRSFTI